MSYEQKETMSNVAAISGAAIGATPIERQLMERAATPEEMETWQKQKQINEIANRAQNSLQRIHEALHAASSGAPKDNAATLLLKSDLDNAARHSQQVAKYIREVKKALFPQVEKAAPITPTTEQ